MLNPVRLPRRLRSLISRSFHHFGIHCASHPKRVILISCVVITSLFYPALAVYSLSNPHALSSLHSIFDVYRSDIQEVWEGHDAVHVLADSTTRARCGMERTLRIERVLVHSSKYTSPGAATPETFEFATKLDDDLRRRISDKDSALSCLRIPTKECFSLSPRLLFPDGTPSTSNDILNVINNPPNVSLAEVPIHVPMLFSWRYVPEDNPDLLFKHIGIIVLTYFFVEKDCINQDGHDEWLETLQVVALPATSVTPFIWQKPNFLALQYDPTLSRPTHFSVISLFLYLSYLVVFLSFSGSLRRMDTVHSRFGLSFTALIEIAASTITSVSVCALAGFQVTMVPWGILPLIIVFVGAENMFLLVDAVTSTPVTLSVKQRIGSGLAVAGTTNTLNTVSYNSILGIIAFFASGAIRQFCSFAIVLLVAHWFLIHTFFVAVLSIDLQRLELGDILSQDKALKRVVPLVLQNQNNGPPPSIPRQTMDRIQQRLRVVPSKNGSLVLMLAVTLILYYITYPFPSRPKHEVDALAFLQHAMRRPAPPTEQLLSPAYNLWDILNPEHDPFVHIRVETPMVMALNSEDSTETIRSGRRQDPRSHGSVMRRGIWLFKIMLLPIGTTTGLLYLLLGYLLKGTDILEAQRTRPEMGFDDGRYPVLPPVEDRITFSTLPRAFANDIKLISTNHDASVIALLSTENEVIIWNGGYHRLGIGDVLAAGSKSSWSKVSVTSIALDYGGHLCAIGAGTGVLAIFNVPPCKLSLDKVPHTLAMTLPGAVVDISFVLVATRPTKDLADNSNLKSERSSEMCFSIVAACDDGMFYLLSPNRGVEPLPPSHTEPVLRTHIEDRTHIAYIYHDGAVELLSYNEDNIWSSTCIIHAGNASDPVTELSLGLIDMNGTTFLVLGVATSAGVVSVWDPSKGERIHVLDNPFGRITRLRLAPMQSQTCQLCGKLSPNAFALAFSVGHTVFVYRFAVSSAAQCCTCTSTRKHFTRDSFGYRSRSGSMTPLTSLSPSKIRSKLPNSAVGAASAELSEFPVSGHGVHSRRAGSERDLSRRASESLLTMQPEEEDLISPWSSTSCTNPLIRTVSADSVWASVIVDYIIDISYERGGWDMIDGRRVVGFRRRSRLPQKWPNIGSGPISTSTSAIKGELPSAVLDRWELWTFNPSQFDSGVRVSSLLALNHVSIPNSVPQGAGYPRLPFTRISPVAMRSSACVAGCGNTTGIVDLSQYTGA